MESVWHVTFTTWMTCKVCSVAKTKKKLWIQDRSGAATQKKCIGQISVGVGIGPFPNNWPSFTPRKSTPMDIWKCFCILQMRWPEGHWPLPSSPPLPSPLCNRRLSQVQWLWLMCSNFEYFQYFSFSFLNIFNIFEYYQYYRISLVRGFVSCVSVLSIFDIFCLAIPRSGKMQ